MKEIKVGNRRYFIDEKFMKEFEESIHTYGAMSAGWNDNKFTVGETFGDRITRLRQAKGLSQKDLAEKLGVTQGTVSRAEGGKVTLLTPTVLAEALEGDEATVKYGDSFFAEIEPVDDGFDLYFHHSGDELHEEEFKRFKNLLNENAFNLEDDSMQALYEIYFSLKCWES